MTEGRADALRLRGNALFQLSLGKKDDCLNLLRRVCCIYNRELERTIGDDRNYIAKNLDDSLQLFEQIKLGKDVLTLGEKLVYMSSKVGEALIFPWIVDPSHNDFSSVNGTYVDHELDSQKNSSGKSSNIEWLNSKDMLTPNDGALVVSQDSFHDCSVVASLISIIGLCARYTNSLEYPNHYLFPFHNSSASSRYVIKLRINGVDRAVEVDDRLPARKNENGTLSNLFLSSKNGALWPLLVEKAYMKAMGGYEFQGSHAALDTFILCGWIPEFISINQLESPSALSIIWKRLVLGWGNGDVMACVGTGENIKPGGELIAMHDYTITDIDSGSKMAEISNPWESTTSNGNKSFWLSFEEISRQFDYLYLNWNPKLLAYKTNLHFLWSSDNMTLSLNTSSYVGCPQYCVQNEEDSPSIVYFVLQQHVTGIDEEQYYLGIRLYENTRSRICLSHEATEYCRSQDLRASYTTLRCTLPAKSAMLLVITAKQGRQRETTGPASPKSFTITTNSIKQLSVKRAEGPLSKRVSVHSHWSKHNIGGNWAEATYSKNPQFKLTISKNLTTCKLYAMTESSVPIALHGFLLGLGREQVRKYNEKALVVGSAKYTADSCWTKGRILQKDSYTIILSAYEKSEMDGKKFWIFCFSDSPVTLEPIARDYAGLFSMTILKNWNGTNRKEIPVSSQRRCDLHLSVKTVRSESSYQPSIRVSVFRGSEMVKGSGNFSDDKCGIFLDSIDVNLNTVYIIVVERMESGMGSFELTLHSSDRVFVGKETA